LPRPVIRCYQALSLAIARAFMKEESNSGYLSNQSKILNDYVGIGEHQSLSDHSCYFYLYANESLKESLELFLFLF